MPVRCIPELPGVAFQCGSLVVPEQRDPKGNPVGGRTITLPFVILTATSAPRQPDPIVYLTDSPGITAFAGLLRVAQYMGEGSDRDVVVLEQRGAGYSNPSLTCPPPPDGDSVFATIQRCRDSLTASGADLGAYTVTASAADYAALMAGLGVPRFNVYAKGFGVRVAAALLGDHPASIRASVWDSPSPPNGRRWRSLNALARLIAQCRADPECGRGYPDLTGQFSSVVERLTRGPVEVGGRRVTADAFLAMVEGGLADQAKLAGIPAGLDAAFRGDWVTAGRRLQRGADIPEGVELARLAGPTEVGALQCSDQPIATEEGPADIWPGPVVQLIEARARLEVRRCALWRVPGQVRQSNPTTAGAPPILVTIGENDPDRGPAGSAPVPRNAILVTVPATAHGAFDQQCPRDLTRSFFAAPDAGLDLACVRRMLPIRFEVTAQKKGAP